MRRLVFQSYTGRPRPLWDKCVASVADYARRIGADYEVVRESTLNIAPGPNSRRSATVETLPIFEKWASFDLLRRGYDEIAVLDADVYAMPGAGNIFEHSGTEPFAAVRERDMPITPEYAHKLDTYEQGQYALLGGVGLPFFNCGVRVIRPDILAWMQEPTARDFLMREEFRHLIEGHGAWRFSTEQTLLCHWLARENVPTYGMAWQWNALYGALRDHAWMSASLAHFFLSDHIHGDDPAELIKTNARERV